MRGVDAPRKPAKSILWIAAIPVSHGGPSDNLLPFPIRDNPADLAKPPPVPEGELLILQPSQVRDLLDRLKGHRLFMLAALALATGMRRNEALGLRWRDIDLEAGRLTIEQALEQANGIVRTKSPKTRAGRRTISLPPSMVTELRAHWAARQEQRMALGLGRSPADGFVLAAIDGGPQRPDPISKAWGEAMDMIGLPPWPRYPRDHAQCVWTPGRRHRRQARPDRRSGVR